MATQLKHTDFHSAPYPPARPNLRVVFDTTTATHAVASALDQLPIATCEATLEELAIGSAAEALVATARHLLSPHVYAAFLRWGVAAVRLVEECASDVENDSRCDQTMKAVREVFDAVPITFEDFAFKTWLAGIEAGDCSCVGPLIPVDSFGTGIRDGVVSIAADIANLSAIVPALNEFASKGWALAGRTACWPTPIAEPVVAAFETAQQIAADLPLPTSFVPRHAERAAAPIPGSTLFDWNATCRAYNDAVAISAATDGENDPDNLVGAAESYALHRLMLTPAPSLPALAIKARLYEETECWELNAAADIARVFSDDLQRFAKLGNLISGDEVLLDAFATYRDAFQRMCDVPPGTDRHEQPLYAIMDPATMTLLDHRATSIEGALAKLRRGFEGMIEDAWGDDAVLDPGSKRFADGLAMGDLYPRIVWSAINDLARMADVSLTDKAA